MFVWLCVFVCASRTLAEDVFIPKNESRRNNTEDPEDIDEFSQPAPLDLELVVSDLMRNISELRRRIVTNTSTLDVESKPIGRLVRRAIAKQLEDNTETTTYKYPTATWTSAYHELLKERAENRSKLYLFKPSPFLKPPFTEENDVSSVDDEVIVSRGKIKWKQDLARVPPNDTVDLFLEQSLMKYLDSSNLTRTLGTVSVKTFSEVLQNVTGTKEKKYAAPYDKNKELRLKFREEVLLKKKSEGKHQGGILEKQLQKRLEKLHNEKNRTVSGSDSSRILWENDNIEAESGEVAETTTEGATTVQNEIEEVKTEAPATERSRRRGGSDRRHRKQPAEFEDEVDNNVPENKQKKQKKQLVTVGSEAPDELKLSVAETVYYRKRQFPIQQFVFQQEPAGVIPGVPEVDYPMYSTAPATGFKCPVGRGERPRMVADVTARCQVFYVCTGDGPAAPMLCPNGTMFNENVSVCDWWYNVSC